MKKNKLTSIKHGMMKWSILRGPAYAAKLGFWYSHMEPSEKWSFFAKSLFKVKVYESRSPQSLLKLLSNVKIDWQDNDYFFYSLDIYKSLHYKDILMENAAIDYPLVLDSSLEELLMEDTCRFSANNNRAIHAIMAYVNRIEDTLPKVTNSNVHKSCQRIIAMKDKPAECLEDALQRILFINQILWQTGHRLVGLGRLDYILDKYITDEMSDEMILDLLTKFCQSLHKCFWFKSSSLVGDTGQIIILGGVDDAGNLVNNRLTQLFMKCIEGLKLPDPKVLLRVSQKTPNETWENALNCILSQTGSPLFANDERIIPALIKFGYKEADAKAYVTSACWEPIAGNSFEQNNMFTIDFVRPLCEALLNEDPEKLVNEDILVNTYFIYLRKHLEVVYKIVKNFKYNEDVLVSSMMKCCRERKADITQGGSDYSNIGLLTVGLANVVNSIISIKTKVYDEPQISLNEYISHMQDNFSDSDFAENLTHQKVYFGQDNSEVLELVNKIVDYVGKFWDEKSINQRCKYKFGLSAPGYVDVAKEVMASPDGRKQGQPYSVHISSDKGVAPTELINFAGQIKLPINGFNGNVVDYFMNPNLIRNNKEAFIMLLKTGVEQGFFELQMNVVDSKTLIAAKANPEKFPYLIVRVWGFSAYFNQLPEEYKDYLIERAKLSELAG